MRHGKKFNHLGRTAPHRKAMLSNMANSLILHKRVSTTVAKAKALRKYVEPIITKAKDDTTHSRRNVFSKLQDKEMVTILFNQVAQKVAERPGGYTRIIKTGNRLGDNADMCIIELVDYNELLLKDSKSSSAKSSTSKRSRRGKKTVDSKESTAPKEAAVKKEEAKAETIEEAVVVEDSPKEEKVEKVKPEVAAPEAKAEEVKEEEKAPKEDDKASEEGDKKE